MCVAPFIAGSALASMTKTLPMAPIMATGFLISLDAHDLGTVSIGTPARKSIRVPTSLNNKQWQSVPD
jgi:hypothetical protein